MDFADQEMNGMTGFVTDMADDTDGAGKTINSWYIVQLEYVVPSRPTQKRIKVKCNNLREHDSLVTDYGLGALRLLQSTTDLPGPDGTIHSTSPTFEQISRERETRPCEAARGAAKLSKPRMIR